MMFFTSISLCYFCIWILSRVTKNVRFVFKPFFSRWMCDRTLIKILRNLAICVISPILTITGKNTQFVKNSIFFYLRTSFFYWLGVRISVVLPIDCKVLPSFTTIPERWQWLLKILYYVRAQRTRERDQRCSSIAK